MLIWDREKWRIHFILCTFTLQIPPPLPSHVDAHARNKHSSALRKNTTNFLSLARLLVFTSSAASFDGVNNWKIFVKSLLGCYLSEILIWDDNVVKVCSIQWLVRFKNVFRDSKNFIFTCSAYIVYNFLQEVSSAGYLLFSWPIKASDKQYNIIR